MIAFSSPSSMGSWRKTLPAAIFLTLLFFFIVYQYHDDVHDFGVKVSSSSHQGASSSSSTKAKPKNAIIAPVQKKDETVADWIAHLLPDWEPVVYVTDRTSDEVPTENDSPITPLNMPLNKGREASVYLTYIIHHYYDLPDYMVFIHGKRYQLHNDEPMLDTYPLISKLNLAHVAEEGYANLRCNWRFCPDPMITPTLAETDTIWTHDHLYATAWLDFFPNTTLPEIVSGPYGAQFAVTRAAIQRWPVDKYEQIRQWVWNAPDEYKAGLVLEALWHVLFGKPAYFCPSARDCYCQKWGLCDLECEDEGWCLGRVWVNPKKNPPMGLPVSLPDNWPEEGQSSREDAGSGYLPFDGWWDDPEVVKGH